MTDMLAYARGYIKLGWSVIPIMAGDKRPLLSSWGPFQKEHATEADLIRWFDGHYQAGIGIVTGAISGLVILDIDGDVGANSMLGLGVPATPMVQTPNGRHVYFEHPGGRMSNAVGMRPGLDVRGDGGYVVAPPSDGYGDEAYEWILSPSEVDLAPPPDWLMRRINAGREPKPSDYWRDLSVSEVQEGHRDDTICRLVGYLVGNDVDPVVVYNLVTVFNEARVNPPLPQKDIKRICRSIVDRHRYRGKP